MENSQKDQVKKKNLFYMVVIFLLLAIVGYLALQINSANKKNHAYGQTINLLNSEKNELIVGRIAAAVAILIAGYLGFDPPGWVAEVVAFAFSLAAASLFPVIFLGIFYKRINKYGAIAGMLAGLFFTYGYIEYFKGLFLKWMGSPWGENIASNWLFGISPEGIGVIGMLFDGF